MTVVEAWVQNIWAAEVKPSCDHVCRDVLPTSLVLVGKVIELDAVGRQFVPYPYLRMRLHAGSALVV